MNVLDDNDAIIHHESNGNGHRHQREIIDAVVAQIHNGECACQRQGHRYTGDKRRPEAAQKKENHHDDQRDAEQERELHVVD